MAGLLDIPIPSLRDIFNGPLGRNGSWVVANLKSEVGWPVKVTEISFRGRPLFLIPMTLNEGERPFKTFPAVALKLGPGEQFEAGQTIISHLLSSLSWVTARSIQVDEWTGGNLPRPMGGFTGTRFIARDFYHPYLPDPQDRDARLALAFYREGLGLNHVAYQCLSFFKILNIFLRRGEDQQAWMNATIPHITEREARQRISFLQGAHGDVGQYLYGSNRCAVAHAGGDPTADPEDPNDLRRLHDDLPLVRALAEHAIEQQFGIRLSTTVYREHLYELEGFRAIFGPDRVEAMKGAGSLPEANWPELPRLNVRLAMHEPYRPLESLTARISETGDGRARVHCVTDDGLTQVMLGLNFGQERLEIDVERGISIGDDGSESAARRAADITRFCRDYVMNGILEVWDAENRRLLGRCDAFIPINVDLSATNRHFNEIISRIEAEADRRSMLPAAPPNAE